MKHHLITGANSTKLYVKESGAQDGLPIIFIHGMFQSHLCWHEQQKAQELASFRIITFDLRGHGQSEKPSGASNYRLSEYWADDIEAILTELEIERAIFVAWSYGGYALCDFVRKYGINKVAGINFVNAAIQLSSQFHMIGEGLLQNIKNLTSPDLKTFSTGTRALLHNCFEQPPSKDFLETALIYNAIVPGHIRLAMVSRQIDNLDILKSINCPLLISFGEKDKIIMPEMADFIYKNTASSTLSPYPDCGHSLFIENKTRFNSELTSFARRL